MASQGATRRRRRRRRSVAAMLLRHRLVQHAIEGGLQQVALALPVGDLAGGVRVARQEGFNLAALLGREFAVGIGVKRPVFHVVVQFVGHFTRLSPVCPRSSSNCRICSRARDRRDITVPTGTPRISETSR